MNLNYMALSRLPNFILYAMFISGIILIMYKAVDVMIRRFRLKQRLKRADTPKAPVIIYLENLVQSATGREIKGETVFTLTMLMLFSLLLITIQLFTLIAAIIASTITAAIPLLLLVVKLETGRSRGSLEGISFVTELHRQYRMHNCNIYEALSAVCDTGSDFPICRKNSYRLLMRLRSASSPSDIRSSVDRFAFAIGTTWGRMLAGCIRLSAENGTDISAGLADIIEQLKHANSRYEERRRLNSESARMTFFMAPALYLSTIWLATKYLGTKFSDFMHDQFLTTEGFLFFMAIVFMFVINLVFINLVSNSKLDY